MYKNKHTKKTRAKINMQKAFECLLQRILSYVSCIFKKFCAKILDAKIVVAEINPQKVLWIYFCNIIFCIKIFCVTVVCVTIIFMFIFHSKETTHAEKILCKLL